jgi:hypothetical protein
MRTNCGLNKSTKRSWGAALVLTFLIFQPLLAGRAEAQGFLFPGGLFHRGTVYRSSVVSNGFAPGMSLSSGPMLNNQTLGLSPFVGQSLSVSPTFTAQSLSVSPTTLSVSPQNVYYVMSGTTPGTTLSLSAQPAGAQTITFTGSPTAEHGMQVLSAGFFGNQTKVNGFLQGLRSKLESLAGEVGKSLSKEDVTDLLLTTAKKALAGTGFGFAIDPVLDLFLKPLIDKIVGEKIPAGTDPTPPGAPARSGTPVAASGGVTFAVSGTIVLTPTSGGVVDPGRLPIPPGTGQGVDLKIRPGGALAPAIGGP